MEAEPQLQIDRLLGLMDARQWNSADLSRRAGVSESVVSLSLSGKRNPSVPTLVQFAAALGCSLDYLVGLSDNPRPARGPEPPPGGVEMLEIMRRLRPEMAAELVRVARAAVDLQRSAEARALKAILDVVDRMADSEAKALLAGALHLADVGNGLDALAQVEGYIARREGETNQPRQKANGDIERGR